jgi:hypothetical protein
MGNTIAKSGKEGVVSQTDFRDIVRQMQVETQRELLKLNNDFPPTRQAADLRRLRWRDQRDAQGAHDREPRAPGGGAKGVGTPPHIVELTKSGALDGLKQVGRDRRRVRSPRR